MSRAAYFLIPALLLGPLPAGADVIERSPAGFTVRTVVAIDVPADRAFAALVQEISKWWDPAHTFSGDAANLSLSAKPGGCFCEALPRGGGVQHAVVMQVVPGELLRLSGAPGPLQEATVTGTWTWQFAATQHGITATVTYTAASYYPGGLDKMAGPVDAVTGEPLRRLNAHVERVAR